ncbi:MAG: FAD:protein FMN transferase [Methylococcaceae bacterium]
MRDTLKSAAYAYSVFFMLGLTGCQNATEAQLEGDIQGTTYHIKMVLDDQAPDLKTLDTAIQAAFRKVDEQMSNWREDSEISRLNQNRTTGEIALSPELHSVLLIARAVYQKSGGCYDLTVKPLIEAWGFARHENRVPAESEITRILPDIGMNQLVISDDKPVLTKLNPAIRIDLGSIGQGYTVEMVSDQLERFGIHRYLAEIGGEMNVKGKKADGSSWRVAIEKPTPFKREIQKVMEIQQQNGLAVMTSGTYRNFFESGGKVYSHIINPKTGHPVTHNLLSVTVLHENPTVADAWSTALLCLGEVDGKTVAEQENLKALFIYHEGSELREMTSTALSREPG